MFVFRIGVRSTATMVAVVFALLFAGTAIGASLQQGGGPVTATRTVTSSDNVSVAAESSSPSSWVNVPGMSTNINVPSGEHGLLIITFSSVTQCTGTSGVFCNIQVLVDGIAASPGPVTFDSADDGPGGSVNSYEANSMQFVAGPKGAGTHSVRVQYSVSAFGQFNVLGRTLTVMRSKR